MEFIFKKDYDEVSKAAAEVFVDIIKKTPRAVLGLATGSTPIGLYKELIESNQRGMIDFSEIKTFNLDEYLGLAPDHEYSYSYFMKDNLFNHIQIKPENCHVPSGIESDYNTYCSHYEELLDSAGGMDILLLGVGENGHIGFNEPDKALSARTHVVDLTEDTIRVNARFFESVEDVPRKAVTMGMGTILKARKIIVLITGENKASVMERLFNCQRMDPEFPISFLVGHTDVTVIADEAACNHIREK